MTSTHCSARAVILLTVTVALTPQVLYAERPFEAERFEATTLAAGLIRPMELTIADDGTVFFIELDGRLKSLSRGAGEPQTIGELKVNNTQENGLIGIALDPDFANNQWLYLQYSPEKYSGQHVSRFTLIDGKLDHSTEKVLLKFLEQRKECCHHSGAMKFGPDGCLFIGTGDNTHPGGDSAGFAPIDERQGRGPFDAQKSSANTNSFSGKILRIRPTPAGSYTIPAGNLFPADGSAGLPEIYVMGCRNPWRLNVDQQTGFLYWGEVGPDAGGDGPQGPRGYDEINQARQAGNFGWPYFIANNRAYAEVDFATKKIGDKYDLEGPANNSPNNTGAKVLPPPQPAFIYYPYAASAEFPQLGTGGRTACAGPVYHFDEALQSATKFPRHFDNVLFIYEWSRHWIKAVHLDDDSNIDKLEPFWPQQRFVRPIDMEFGPEGALYLIEYGETWGVNKEARIVRIDYIRGNRRPVAKASATNNIGRQPLTVALSSEGTFDKDPSEQLTYLWRATKTVVSVDGKTSTTSAPVVLAEGPSPAVKFTDPGVYNVELVVTDSTGASSAASVPVLVGNARPQIEIKEPRSGAFFDPTKPVHFQIYVKDHEDGTSDFDEADDKDLQEIDAKSVDRVSVNAFFSAGNAGQAGDEGPLGLRMMKQSDCFNCHAVNQKRVGPPLLEVARKYRDKEGALEASVQRVLNGSTGVWGKIPMIPHKQHTAEEAREMVSWVHSLQDDGGIRVFRGFVGDIPPAEDAEAQSKKGVFVLSANYIDLGHQGIPPLTTTATVQLRNRLVEAELADENTGAMILGGSSAGGGRFIGAINDGHQLRFDNLNLQLTNKLTMRVTSAGAGGKIEVRLDKPDGKLLGTVDVAVNGSWDKWYERSMDIEPQAGIHKLYIRFVNPGKGALMNLDSIYFHPLEN